MKEQEKKDFQVVYNPFEGVRFINDISVDAHLQILFGVGIASKKTYTSRKIYFLRQKDDTLQYFTNVIDRQQLYDNVKEVIKDVPAKELYIDKAEFVVPMGMTTLEGFSEVIENILPAIWKEPCPFKGQEDMFLDQTMVAVMTITGSRSGLVCCRIRRIYRY